MTHLMTEADRDLLPQEKKLVDCKLQAECCATCVENSSAKKVLRLHRPLKHRKNLIRRQDTFLMIKAYMYTWKCSKYFCQWDAFLNIIDYLIREIIIDPAFVLKDNLFRLINVADRLIGL